MKIGFTSYSFAQALNAGTIQPDKLIDFIADCGGEHLEVTNTGFPFTGADDPAIARLRKQAEARGIALSSYTIGANFVTTGEDRHTMTDAERKAEIARLKGQVDIAAALGVTRMRHDAGWRPIPQCGYEQYEADLPAVAEACAEIADYAAPAGIVTSVENHGYLFQGSERVKRLVQLVNRPNYRTTLDVGNFVCADEDPVSAVQNNISIASMIHFKDFYIRNRVPDTTSWFPSAHGRFLRGAVTGFGDLDLFRIAQIIRDSGYDGFVSVEYEGHEECLNACKQALKNVRALFGL